MRELRESKLKIYFYDIRWSISEGDDVSNYNRFSRPQHKMEPSFLDTTMDKTFQKEMLRRPCDNSPWSHDIVTKWDYVRTPKNWNARTALNPLWMDDSVMILSEKRDAFAHSRKIIEGSEQTRLKNIISGGSSFNILHNTTSFVRRFEAGRCRSHNARLTYSFSRAYGRNANILDVT